MFVGFTLPGGKDPTRERMQHGPLKSQLELVKDILILICIHVDKYLTLGSFLILNFHMQGDERDISCS